MQSMEIFQVILHSLEWYSNCCKAKFSSGTNNILKCKFILGTKMQEIVVSRGKILELLRPDANTGKVHTLLTVEVFGIVRSILDGL